MYPLHCDLCATSFPDYAAKRQHLLSAAHQAIQSNFLQYKANLGISLFSVLLPKHTDRAEVCTSCCTLFWRPGSLDLHRASYRYVGKQPCGHHNIAHCGNTDWSNAVCKIPKLRRFITMPEDRAEWDAHIASDVHLKNVGSDRVSKIVEHISHALVMTAAEIKEAEGRKDRVSIRTRKDCGGHVSSAAGCLNRKRERTFIVTQRFWSRRSAKGVLEMEKKDLETAKSGDMPWELQRSATSRNNAQKTHRIGRGVGFVGKTLRHQFLAIIGKLINKDGITRCERKGVVRYGATGGRLCTKTFTVGVGINEILGWNEMTRTSEEREEEERLENVEERRREAEEFIAEVLREAEVGG
ncbi:hypothetical protein FPQ18DRAFT_305845 [Pyronema domesticum]|nr:hypothetical protein FPQ18DRAFT_305845 [Pyronema domesticum]